jgi:hypothetical protein
MTERSREADMLKFVLKEVLQTIRESSGFESVAIRLREEGDFPYFLQIGFTKDFVRKECTLNVKDKEGNLVMDAEGTPFVECMCGNVLRRRVNPTREYFTEEGAFWTNSTTLNRERKTGNRQNPKHMPQLWIRISRPNTHTRGWRDNWPNTNERCT